MVNNDKKIPDENYVEIKVQDGNKEIYDAEFNRFIDFFTEMIIKYGPSIDLSENEKAS